MKKIIPFNNIIELEKDINEITSISLEPTINKEQDLISGKFNISGEYSLLNQDTYQEPFNYELPFDIALGSEYNLETLKVDVDDFRYELLSKNKLKVNIDMYVDGEIREELPTIKIEEIDTRTEESNQLDEVLEEQLEEPIKEMIINNTTNESEEKNKEPKETKENKLFKNFNEEEKYITYHVYPVTEKDTLELIIEKFHTTKEIIYEYNQIEDIKPGTKLIIPEKNVNNNS